MSSSSTSSPPDAPNVLQLRDAYSQLTADPAASASSSNSLPLPSPAELAARRLRQASSQPRAKRVRKGYIDCGGYMIPRPPAAPIEGRGNGQNQGSAEALRVMLEDDDTEASLLYREVDESLKLTFQDHPQAAGLANRINNDASAAASAPARVEPLSEGGPLAFSCTESDSDKLAEAFRSEYYRAHRAGQQDYGALPPLPTRAAVHPWLDVSNLVWAPSPAKKRKATQSNALTLPGIDSKRQRNRYGRGHQAGQETGVGVIGSVVSLNVADTVHGYSTQLLTGPHGCDGPTYDFDTYDHVFKDEFDPDMPPLAIEHPARIWNSLIQSLPSDAQPIIKWTYEQTTCIDQQEGWTATLSLALPPTHPILGGHPLRCTLPKIKYSKEYLNVIKVLGGLRSWSGEARRLKADATNVTLVKCMSDGGLEWVRDPSPSLLVIEDEVQSEDDVSTPRVVKASDKWRQLRADRTNDRAKPDPIDREGVDRNAKMICKALRILDVASHSGSDDSSRNSGSGQCTRGERKILSASSNGDDQTDGDAETSSNPSNDEPHIPIRLGPDEKSPSAYEVLSRLVGDYGDTTGHRVTVQVVVTVRHRQVGWDLGFRAAHLRYGSYVALELDGHIVIIGDTGAIHRTRAMAVESACQVALDSQPLTESGLDSLFRDMGGWDSAFDELTDRLTSTVESLEIGQQATWPAWEWIRYLIRISLEHGPDPPSFDDEMIKDEDWSRSHAGRVVLGSEPTWGPQCFGEDPGAGLIQYSWAVAARKILQIMDMRVNLILLEKPCIREARPRSEMVASDHSQSTDIEHTPM